jgi:hypothetical protein
MSIVILFRMYRRTNTITLHVTRGEVEVKERVKKCKKIRRGKKTRANLKFF